MELALRTLHSREQSVLETALAAGFGDHSSFSHRPRFERAPAYSLSRNE
jgi:AraC-like DNA-binding protein